jgi:hypothetical protein
VKLLVVPLDIISCVVNSSTSAIIFSSLSMSSSFVLLFAIAAATAADNSATWGSTGPFGGGFFDLTKLLKSASTSSIGVVIDDVLRLLVNARYRLPTWFALCCCCASSLISSALRWSGKPLGYRFLSISFLSRNMTTQVMSSTASSFYHC